MAQKLLILAKIELLILRQFKKSTPSPTTPKIPSSMQKHKLQFQKKEAMTENFRKSLTQRQAIEVNRTVKTVAVFLGRSLNKS